MNRDVIQIEVKKYVENSMNEDLGSSDFMKKEFSRAINRLPKRPNMILKSNVRKSQSCSKAVENIYLPMRQDSFSCFSAGDYSTMLENNFLGVPEEFENPQEAFKIALRAMKEDNWETSTPAVINIMQISRFQPELLDSSMPLINRSLCSLLKNSRPQIVRTACQVAMELYKTIQYTQRPEFDKLVNMLLLKSAHTKKEIREDARRALEAMVFHVPPSISIQILAADHGASHQNPLIRGTVSFLLLNVINVIGIDSLLSNRNLKDTRQRIFKMCIMFLVDAHHETRVNAKKSLKLLMRHNDFEISFHQDIDQRTANNVKKQLISIKYA